MCPPPGGPKTELGSLSRAGGSLDSGELCNERGRMLGSRSGERELLWGTEGGDVVPVRTAAGAVVLSKTTFLCAA